MADPSEGSQVLHPSSKGHALAGSDWQDAHFNSKRSEYETMLRSVGLRKGWRVLDAGAGNGSYLPLIAQEVGPTGKITALDVAPENIAIIERRVPGWSLDCPVEALTGDLLSIPAPDDSFDAVWCANTFQYLSDEELTTSLHEFRRVVRPGGLVAIKDFVTPLWNISPGDPARIWRLMAVAQKSNSQLYRTQTTLELHNHLVELGLDEVWDELTMVQLRAPLRSAERQFVTGILGHFARIAQDTELSEEDRQFWQSMLDPDECAATIADGRFCYYDGQVVAVGRVPFPA